MSIPVSQVQTEQYSKNYGNLRQDFLARGETLSSCSVTNGTLRAFYDTITFTEDVIPVQVIFGWKFTEEALIVAGNFEVTSAVEDSSPLIVRLYDGDTHKSNEIKPVSQPIDTFRVHSDYHLYLDTTIKVAKGNVVGIETLSTGNHVKSGVSFSYILTYMSSL